MPAKAPLPITDNGYLSHLIGALELSNVGGQVSPAAAWLAR